MPRLLMRAALALTMTLSAITASAELGEIKVAQQYGISYLPLMIMEDQKLIEKKTGRIKVKPDSWKGLFFPNMHGLPGS